MSRLPVVAITMGDPAGVGPEVCLKAVRSPRVRRCCVPLIVGDLEVLRLHARRMRLPGRLAKVSAGALPDRALTPSDPAPVVDLKNVAARDRVFGEVRPGFFGAEMAHPRYQFVDADAPLPESLTPIYPTTSGVSQKE
ncbi:MAG: hypothetical protein AABZ64_13310, partial [Nitrospinota bacterium]